MEEQAGWGGLESGLVVAFVDLLGKQADPSYSQSWICPCQLAGILPWEMVPRKGLV